MQELIIEAKTPHIIHGGDCDVLGHLNNARYIEYFHNAREDHLINIYNYAMADLIKHESVYVVGNQEIFYFRSALCYEKVIIQSSIINMDESKIHVEFVMFNEAQNEVKSIMWTEYIALNKATGKRDIISKERKTFFESLLNKKVNFEKGILSRHKELKALIA